MQAISPHERRRGRCRAPGARSPARSRRARRAADVSRMQIRMIRSIVPFASQAFFSALSASAPGLPLHLGLRLAARLTLASGCASCWTRRASSPAFVLYQTGAAVVKSSARAAMNTTQSLIRRRSNVKSRPRAPARAASRSRAATLTGNAADVGVAALRRAALVAHGDQAAGEDAERRDEAEPETDLAAVGLAGQVEDPDQDEDQPRAGRTGRRATRARAARPAPAAWRSRPAPRSRPGRAARGSRSRTVNDSQAVLDGSPYQRQEERDQQQHPARAHDPLPHAQPSQIHSGAEFIGGGGSRRRRPRAEGCLGTAAGDGARRSRGKEATLGCVTQPPSQVDHCNRRQTPESMVRLAAPLR